jgi:hypothetical protein
MTILLTIAHDSLRVSVLCEHGAAGCAIFALRRHRRVKPLESTMNPVTKNQVRLALYRSIMAQAEAASDNATYYRALAALNALRAPLRVADDSDFHAMSRLAGAPVAWFNPSNRES